MQPLVAWFSCSHQVTGRYSGHCGYLPGEASHIPRIPEDHTNTFLSCIAWSPSQWRKGSIPKDDFFHRTIRRAENISWMEHQPLPWSMAEEYQMNLYNCVAAFPGIQLGKILGWIWSNCAVCWNMPRKTATLSSWFWSTSFTHGCQLNPRISPCTNYLATNTSWTV